MVKRTEQGWKEEYAKRQAIADKQRMTFTTNQDWMDHNKGCPDCNITEKPYKFCEKSLELHMGFAPKDWFKMPHLTCLNCKEEWEEDEYYNTEVDDTLVCPNCGLKHEVTCTELELSVELKHTGEFDASYLPDTEED